MNKIKLIVVVTLMFLLFPSTKVLAVCPSDSISKLKMLATNINYDYSYTETNNGIIFQVRFTNVHPKLYIYDDINKKSYYGDNNSEVKIGNLEAGKQYKFVVKSSDRATSSNRQEVTVIIDGKESTIVYDSGDNSSECKNIEIVNKYVNLPYYNIYYKDELCNGMEQYKICSKWNRTTLSYEEFKNEIQKIKNQEEKEETKKTNIEDKTLTQMIITFLQENLVLVGSIIALVSIVGVLIYRKTKESDFNGW